MSLPETYDSLLQDGAIAMQECVSHGFGQSRQ
jgi:hypothetical protein